MFPGLDDIDWHSLSHAHGTADDVPGWIRGLTDTDAEAREESFDALYSAVRGEGEAYDATAAVVPYLIEALATPDLPGREDIAELLGDIADAGDWPDDAGMRRHAKRARALVVAAAPALLRLVDDPAPALRAAAPQLLVALAATTARR